MPTHKSADYKLSAVKFYLSYFSTAFNIPPPNPPT